MKVGLVIASRGRPDILQQTLEYLMLQRRVPDEIVVSAVEPSDVYQTSAISNLHIVFGSPGLTLQRNRGISYLIDKMDLIAFIDDDFLVGNDYFLNLEKIFEADQSIIGVNGYVVADGAKSPGFTFQQGLHMVKEHEQRDVRSVIRDIEATYGCNMAFRCAGIGTVRFDERLPLYGWLEDLDFCGALRGRGRIVTTNLAWGVHLGTKSGKGSEVRLGYSQIINPAYIVRKGNMSIFYALRLMVQNVLANAIKSVTPEGYVDRRGRLRGNLIGIFHLILGRLTPEHVLKLN